MPTPPYLHPEPMKKSSSGPRGKGTIRAVANQTGGVWQFTYLQVSVDGQPTSIALLSIQPPPERDF